MWRSSALALLLLTFAAPPARADVCSPPLFEGGTRLIRPGDAQLLWLEPLLRQHEVCWRKPRSADERRVFVYGSSSIFGFPHPSPQSAIGLVNRAFETDGVPAHLFNLGMVFTNLTKDSLIVHESQRFAPDLIVYSTTLDDFIHFAPSGHAPLEAYFRHNSATIDRLATEELPGINEPLDRYSASFAEERPFASFWRRLRQGGLFVRIGMNELGQSIRSLWFPRVPPEEPPINPAHTSYDCREVRERFELAWRNWRDWNLLPYLAQLREETGVEILVVNWPVAHEPVDDCHNARYPTRAFQAFNRWIRVQAISHEFRFLDLQGTLDAEHFLDSIHPTLEGQRRIATHLEAALRDLLPETRPE